MSPKAKRALVQVLSDLDDRTVISVEDVAELIGISRSAAYEAAKRGDIPVRRVGRRLFVPVPALRRWLGVDPDANDSATAGDESPTSALGRQREN